MTESFTTDVNHVDVREKVTHEWMVSADILLSTRLRVCTVKDACGSGQVEDPGRHRESSRFDFAYVAGPVARHRPTLTHARRTCCEAERDAGRGGYRVFVRCRNAAIRRRGGESGLNSPDTHVSASVLVRGACPAMYLTHANHRGASFRGRHRPGLATAISRQLHREISVPYRARAIARTLMRHVSAL